MRIILVTGYKGEGKDTIADYITKHYKATSMSLAYPIKSTAMDWMGLSYNDVNGDGKEKLLEEYGVTPRQFLQYMGTDVMQFGMMKRFTEFKKRVGRTFWCRKLLRRAEEVVAFGYTLVLSDVRFPHEVDYFRSQSDDVFVIRVMRHTIPWYKKLFWHESESAVDKIRPDAYISNVGTKEQLYSNVDKIMSVIGMEKNE